MDKFVDVFDEVNNDGGFVDVFDTETTAPAKPEKSGFIRRAFGDTGLSALKGAVAVPEAAVGLADIVSGGRAGKLAEQAGFRPKEAKSLISDYYSPEYKANLEKFQNADGFVDKTLTAIQNPSLIGNTLVESAPLIGAGGVIGRGVTALAPKVSGLVAGAVGEGAVTAGLNVEGIRQETEDGLLTPKQSALGAASGFATGAISLGAGRVANKLGIDDVDTAIVNGVRQDVTKSAPRRIIEGAFTEGVLEELPQSLQEQALQNIALDKPVTEGLDDAAALGLLSGGVMGAGINALPRPRISAINDDGSTTELNPDGGVLERAAIAGIESGAARGVINNQSLADDELLNAIESQNVRDNPVTDLVAANAGLGDNNASGSGADTLLLDAGIPQQSAIPSDTQEPLPSDATNPFARTADGTLDTAVTTVDLAAQEAATSELNDLAQPTDAQKEAGNYKVGRVKVGGLDISIENPLGSVRKGIAEDGQPFENVLQDNYGYFKGVKARSPDKEHVDTFIKKGTAEDFAGDVFVVNQNNQQTGVFDEPKVLLGYANSEEAKAGYLSNYNADFKGFGSITQLPFADFKERLNDEKAFLQPVINATTSEQNLLNPSALPIDIAQLGAGANLGDLGANTVIAKPNTVSDNVDIGLQGSIIESLPKSALPKVELNRQTGYIMAGNNNIAVLNTDELGNKNVEVFGLDKLSDADKTQAQAEIQTIADSIGYTVKAPPLDAPKVSLTTKQKRTLPTSNPLLKKSRKTTNTLHRQAMSNGGISRGDAIEIYGLNLPKGVNPSVAKAALFRKNSRDIISQVSDGLYDDFLPPDMRHESYTFDSIKSEAYIKDLLAQRTTVLPYDVESELKKSEMYAPYNGSAEADIATIAELFTDAEINAMLREAGYDEREAITDAQVFEDNQDDETESKPRSTQSSSQATLEKPITQNTDSDIVSGQGSPSGTASTERNQQQPTPVKPQENARPIVEAITKRHTAAREIGKETQFKTALAQAKKLMNGEAVGVGHFKLAVAVFKPKSSLGTKSESRYLKLKSKDKLNKILTSELQSLEKERKLIGGDGVLSDLYQSLVDMAQATPQTEEELQKIAENKAKSQEKISKISSYKQRIADAKTIDALQTLAGEIQRDSALSDSQAATLDDAVFDAQDALDFDESPINDVDNRTLALYELERERANKVRESVASLKKSGASENTLKVLNDEANNIDKNADKLLSQPKTEQSPEAAPVKADVQALENANDKPMDNQQKAAVVAGRDYLKWKKIDWKGEDYWVKVFTNFNPYIEKPTGYFRDSLVWAIGKTNYTDADTGNPVSINEITGNALERLPKGLTKKVNDFYQEKQDQLLNKDNLKADLLGDNTAAKQAIADAERAKDDKRNTGTDNASDFNLSGSYSEADKAIASGAQALFSAQDNQIELIKNDAIAYAKENFVGNSYINKSDGKAILVGSQGIKHAMSGKVSEVSAVALTKLDEILTNAKFVRSEPDKANRNTIKEVRFYQVPVTMLGNQTDIEVVVRVATDGSRYYDHFEIKNPAGQSGKSDNQNSTQPFTGLVSLDDSSILKQSFSNVNNIKKGNLTVADVKKSVANDIYGQDIDVYQSMDDAPLYVQTQANSEGASGVEGFFDKTTNRVALIADNLPDVKRAVEVARHELIGHYGMENMLNDTDKTLFPKLLKRVLFAEKAGNKVIKDIAAYVLDSQPALKVKATDSPTQITTKQMRKAKEIIAVMAERNTQNSITQQVIDAIRTFLKKIGFIKGDITDAKIAGLLRDAQRYLKAQGRSVVEASDSSFSAKAQTDKPSAQLANDVLESAYKNKGVTKFEGGNYLVATMDKVNRGIFIVNGNIDRETYSKIIAEAKENNLDTKKIYAYSKSATYTGSSITAIKLDDFVNLNDYSNNGNFDPNNNDINFSNRNPQGRLTPQWDSLPASKMDNFIYTLQDKNVDLKRVTQNIKSAVGNITDRWNAYLQEELYHGRTAKRTQDFLKQELEPLIQAMQNMKVSMTDFEEYLWMRHAQERNIQIAKVNPDMQDGGAGVTTADANAYLDGLSPALKTKYQALAKRIDAINARSRQMLVDYGLESPATISAWQGAYENYVPLMREDMDAGFGNGTGQGFSIKGNSSKRATGSNRAVVDIIANIAQQYEKNIIRGEKNRVSTALIGLATLNPNEGFWKVNTVPMIKGIGKDGLVFEGPDPNYKTKDNVIVARIPNQRGEIIEQSVMFEPGDERAMRMAQSLKNLDQDQIGEFLGTASMVTRYFASINTQYNPIFGIINIIRDVQGAILNLSSTALAGKQKEVMKHTLPALKGIYTDIRNARDGKSTGGYWAELFEEFQNEGGQTGYRDMFRNAKERGEAIEQALDPDYWQKSKLGKILTVNGSLAVPQQILLDKVGKPLFNWLSDYNSTLENAVRLSAYKVALDSGISKQQAASIAKNLTVNFNRKGEIGRQVGALYAFFNASVQGTARLAETLQGKTGKRIIYGGILLGVIQAIAMAEAGFDEEEPPEFVRDRNIIIPTGDGKFMSIPMPLGFNVLPAFGRIMTEFALSGFKKPAKRATHLIEVFMDMFNPIGNAGLSIQTLTPTALDPLSALAENKDFSGRNIARKDMNSLDPTPGFTRAKDTATGISKALSYGFNYLSGGTEDTQGSFSPTPDQIDYLIGQVFGGVGREYQKIEQAATSAVTGEDLPSYKVPVLGRFLGDTNESAGERNAFYNNVRKMNGFENRIKGMRERGEDVKAFIDETPETKLIMQSKNVYSRINKLRDNKKRIMEQSGRNEDVDKIEAVMTDLMKSFNERVQATEAL